MKQLQRVAFIGNHLPRRCGIATFTHDLHRAVATARPDLETCVVAMTDPGGTYDYPPAVRFQIRDDVIGDYVQAAEFLNNAGFDVVCLQHEYGIFGGEAGGNIVELLSRLEMPIVTTLHTVLSQPTPAQRDVMRRIIDASAKLVVMSEKGRELLRSVHDVPARKIEVIPHGIPDVPFLETHHAKAKFGFGGKTVILTFGLLSPNKGIEIMLDAMPGIVESCPNAVYVILGATHPNLVRHQGEAYRESLTARVQELGIEDHVVFFDQFVDQATLLDFISMCDVYVTPYLNEAQMTSGTLAYSFGLGKAVVSTPYWHAKELLADGRGILVPFGDAKALGAEIAGLLTNDVRRHSMRKRAYAASRSMTWAQTAERYLASFETAREHVTPAIVLPVDRIVSRSKGRALPEIETGHFLSLCDGTGMLQHAVHSVADRAHGYCVDDNARALLFSSALASSGEAQLPETVTARFAAFIQHAWNPDTRRFRNFMSYDRRWLEATGLGGQSRADALGVGRMRPPRQRSVPPPMGCGALQDRASRGRGVHVSARLGLHAPGVGRLLRGGRRRPLRQPHARTAGRQVDVHARGKDNQGLALVRGCARLRQRAPAAGADPDGPGDSHAALRRGRPAIAALAHVAADGAVGLLQAGRHRELRQSTPATGSVRSAARGGGSNDFRLPCGLAGRSRRGVAGRGDAGVRLVPGRERPADNADRSRYGQLLGWAPSGSTQ